MAFLTLVLVGLVVVLGLPSAALAATPIAQTSDVFSTGAATATVDGVVDPMGESTTYAVQWDLNSSTWCQNFGASGSPANTTAATPFVGNTINSVSVDLTGLVGGTHYCAQLIATNGSGESDGGTVDWIQGLPAAITTTATPTGTTTATIAGTVNPTGQGDNTYSVQYDLNSSTWCQNFGTTGSPAHTTGSTALPFSDNTSHDVSVGLTGLTAGTHYCAQLIATNGSGEGDGGTVDWTQPFSLTVSRAGTGSGTVTSSPAGINCGATCAKTFAPGTQVTLTGSPAAGSAFAGWSGGGCSGTGTCKVTLNANTAVTATFTPVHTLTVSLAGSGSGSVTSSPAGIDCGATCAHAFKAGTQITLTASASQGNFAGWSGGGCSGTGTCVVTLNSDTTVTATFSSSPPPPPPPTKCVVPNVKGKKLAAAKSSIKSHHCSVGKITKVSSSPKNRGHVVSQSPKPGKRLAKGAKVALKVGK
jgi:hypothetical protein